MSDTGQQEQRWTNLPIDTRLGEILRALREREGLTQRELAGRLGVNFSYISKLEKSPGGVSITFFRRWCRELREPEHKVMRFALKVSSQETNE